MRFYFLKYQTFHTSKIRIRPKQEMHARAPTYLVIGFPLYLYDRSEGTVGYKAYFSICHHAVFTCEIIDEFSQRLSKRLISQYKADPAVCTRGNGPQLPSCEWVHFEIRFLEYVSRFPARKAAETGSEQVWNKFKTMD